MRQNTSNASSKIGCCSCRETSTAPIGTSNPVNGLMAATLVREGFKGASEALEGKHGFMHAYAPNPKPERAVQGRGVP